MSVCFSPRRANGKAFFTVVFAQTEVAVDQRGSAVEVLRHVVQPLGLDGVTSLAARLHPQRHLHRVVLQRPLASTRVVKQAKKFST